MFLIAIKLTGKCFKMKLYVFLGWIFLCPRSCISLLTFISIILYWLIMLWKYKLLFSQLIGTRLLNPFSDEKGHLLFCNKDSDPRVTFKCSHYVFLILCFQKNSKNKTSRKRELPSDSTSNLKSSSDHGVTPSSDQV